MAASLTPLSAPPSRAAAPATYVVDMDAFLAQLPDLVTEINALTLADLFTYATSNWTPVLADAETAGNAASAGTTTGRYIRIGRLVMASFGLININTAGLTGANPVYIQGLPFASFNDTASYHAAPARLTNITFATEPQLYIKNNTSAIQLNRNVSGGAPASIPVSALTSGTAAIQGTICYRVND